MLHFFRSIGLPFSEIYGMSENTGGMTWDPYRVRPGTVGRPYPGVEVRLLDDGEVVCRGGIVSRGYLDDPERTAETFDADGWLHTGDIGRLDADGYLSIVDRKKELIITAGGKNVSPANIEARLKSLPLVGQACVVGDARPYLVALLVLDPEVAPVWARAEGLAATDLASLAADPSVRAELERGVADGERALLPGGGHQAVRGAGRRVGAGLAAADRDDEAQAPRRAGRLRRRDRVPLRRLRAPPPRGPAMAGPAAG